MCRGPRCYAHAGPSREGGRARPDVWTLENADPRLFGESHIRERTDKGTEAETENFERLFAKMSVTDGNDEDPDQPYNDHRSSSSNMRNTWFPTEGANAFSPQKTRVSRFYEHLPENERMADITANRTTNVEAPVRSVSDFMLSRSHINPSSTDITTTGTPDFSSRTRLFTRKSVKFAALPDSGLTKRQRSFFRKKQKQSKKFLKKRNKERKAGRKSRWDRFLAWLGCGDGENDAKFRTMPTMRATDDATVGSRERAGPN